MPGSSPGMTTELTEIVGRGWAEACGTHKIHAADNTACHCYIGACGAW